MMRARVDKSLCMGCGICPDICPEVFAMDGDQAVVPLDKVPAGAEVACRDASQQCPGEAITIEEN
jgi:ferredoxin